MNARKLGYWSLMLMLLHGATNVSAQDTTTENTAKFPAQVSIVYPYGTHGRKSVDYSYNFSLNLLTGKVGGVNGLEFGGLLNRVENGVNGVQVAGLGNVAGGKVNGIQFSGLCNISEDLKGIQVAGLSNISGSVGGIQFSGLGNISGNITGIQVGGLFNISESVRGLQFSGLSNITDDVSGTQVSGLVNISASVRGLQVGGLANITESASGTQVGGLFNISETVSGIQFAGIFNISESYRVMQFGGIANLNDNSRGFQFAGITNINNRVSGVSIGGLFNRTNTLRGFQFGIVNVTDTIEKGISMAIVNIVKNGFYDEWELSFSDYVNAGLSYKMGTQKFYTIYTLGANFIEDDLWVAGIGFGNRTAISSKFDFQPELVFHTYFPNDFKNIQYTSATHLKLGFIYNFNEKLGLKLAPSFYVMNDERNGSSNSDYYKISPISSFYSHENDNSKFSLGMGICVGLILR